ncbi:MAG: ABC transporter substrate-binding protein, partial [Anaerolineales bacterium]|nr:ABC transporter substrate-binding protein [Anaerolineales bacterium]
MNRIAALIPQRLPCRPAGFYFLELWLETTLREGSMYRKFVFLLSLLVILLAACTAVQPTEAPPPTPTVLQPTATPEVPAWPREFTDDLGRTITLDAPPSAIVTLGASLLESLFAIQAGDLIVGRDDTSTFPEEALEIADIGSLFGELPLEAILALEPDLVLAPEIISTEQVSALEEVGLTVYWQANPTDFEGLYTNLKVLGGLTDHETDAINLIFDLQGRVDAVTEALDGVQDKPKVFYELDATDPQN